MYVLDRSRITREKKEIHGRKQKDLVYMCNYVFYHDTDGDEQKESVI